MAGDVRDAPGCPRIDAPGRVVFGWGGRVIVELDQRYHVACASCGARVNDWLYFDAGCAMGDLVQGVTPPRAVAAPPCGCDSRVTPSTQRSGAK